MPPYKGGTNKEITPSKKTTKKAEKRVNRKSKQRYLKRIHKQTNNHNIYLCNHNQCIICAKSYVANLSGRTLTDPQILLLSKGLSFIPTCRDATHFELLRDFDAFCHKIRSLSKLIRKNRYGYNKDRKRLPLYKKEKCRSRYRRHFASSTDVEGVLETMKLELLNITTTTTPHNLSPEERKALRELKHNTDLVINKADKGSTIVVQAKADYIRDGLEHLNDPRTYKKLEGDPTKSICCGINQLLYKFYNEGTLNKSMVEFCSPPKKARLARLYFLKKIHKSPMGVRPIVSSCESPTENISQFIDYWLQPIMKALPSFLKDTTQLINELKDLVIEPNSLLVTVDVKSLYTCIPHQEGIQACAESLQNSKANYPDQPDTKTLINLLELVLKNNTFEFDGKSYIQLQGTAMGTKLAPAYANIFMGKLEHTILSSAPLQPTYYKRYIDDILIIWPHSISELDKFIHTLNNYHPLIKFTSETSFEKITFLDVNIYKGPNFYLTNKLDVQTYIKPTNRQAYVHASSYHPPGTGKGVAVGEIKRYLRTNSRAESFHALKVKHRHNLRKRGYSTDFINRHTNNVRFLDRSFELKPKNKTNEKRQIAFITRYTPSATKAMKIIRKYWPSLKTTKHFKGKIMPYPLLTFKSNRNIKSYLVRAKIPPSENHAKDLPPMELSLNFSGNLNP